MKTSSLQARQLDTKMQVLKQLDQLSNPPTGWIRAVRSVLGMTLFQLARKLSISKQSVMEMEKREAEGSVTIKSLREVGNALDMHLVYGFIPKDGSLEDLIERKARELATQIVMRTSQSMKLEDQEVSGERLKKAIEERKLDLMNEMPKILWD